MDFDGDLYGRELSLELVRRLRDEEKYASVEQLPAAGGQGRGGDETAPTGERGRRAFMSHGRE